MLFADVMYASTGDRVWFHWDKEYALRNSRLFAIQEVEKCINPLSKPTSAYNEREHLINLFPLCAVITYQRFIVQCSPQKIFKALIFA